MTETIELTLTEHSARASFSGLCVQLRPTSDIFRNLEEFLDF